MSPTQGFITGCLLLIALFVYTFWPDNSLAGQHEKTRLDFLRERQEQLAENLRDLQFEFNAGKYPPEEFQTQLRLLEDEQMQLRSQIELLEHA